MIDQVFKAVIPIVKEAGKLIRSSSKNIKTVETKSSKVDLVTEVDKNVEKLLFQSIRKLYPDHLFIGEESTNTKIKLSSTPTWIIDPIDGTTNFVHSFPQVAISIAHMVEKEIVIGIVYNPFEDNFFYAKKGQGSFCNDEKLHVSEVEELSKALVVTEIGSCRDTESIQNVKENLSYILANCQAIRMKGSAALNMCAVAAGEADAYYEYGLHCWDMAAAYLIVKEAGGVCVDTEGGPLDILKRRVICASSQKIIDELSAGLKHRMPESD